MKNRRVTYIILALLVSFLLTGCGCSIVENKKITNAAIKYLKEKYNIKRKDIKIESNEFYGESRFCLPVCDNNRMSFKYKNKSYFVYYDRESKTYSDNVQYETIKKAVANKVYKEYGKPIELKIDFSKLNTEYYNGTNLKNVTKSLSITASYVDKKDYDEDKTNNFINDLYNGPYGEIKFLFFKTVDDYKKYNDIVSANKFDHYADRYIDFIHHIQDGATEKKTSIKVNLGYGFIAVGWDLPDGITLKKIQPFDLNNISKYNSELYTIDSGFYRLSSEKVDIKKDFYVMRVDDTITEDKMVASRTINSFGEVTYSLNNATYNGKFIFTKYGPYDKDFVIIKKTEQ